MASPYVLLYDRDCGFCRWAADRIVRWARPRRLRAVAIQGAEGRDLLVDLDEATAMSSWHLVMPDGGRASGGAAVSPLARVLPFARPLALIADRFPGATDRAYRWVARHRGSLGRLLGARACSVDPSSR